MAPRDGGAVPAVRAAARVNPNDPN
jgi:hypothetical protein